MIGMQKAPVYCGRFNYHLQTSFCLCGVFCYLPVTIRLAGSSFRFSTFGELLAPLVDGLITFKGLCGKRDLTFIGLRGNPQKTIRLFSFRLLY